MRRPCCTVAAAMALAVGCCKHPTESSTTEHQLPVKDVYSSPDCQTKPNRAELSRASELGRVGDTAARVQKPGFLLCGQRLIFTRLSRHFKMIVKKIEVFRCERRQVAY